jgi:hypothetical protein
MGANFAARLGIMNDLAFNMAFQGVESMKKGRPIFSE